MASRKAAPALRRLLSGAAGRQIRVGDQVPDVSFDLGFPPRKVPLRELCSEHKRLVIVGLPGAFTPTCSSRQIPGYLGKQDELKKHGVEHVAVCAVNDGAVMDAWARDQGTKGSLLELYGDPRSEVAEAFDLVLDHPGPMSVLGNPRCKRFSMLVDSGRVKAINVAASEEDPAGDARPEVSLVEQMLEDLREE